MTLALGMILYFSIDTSSHIILLLLFTFIYLETSNFLSTFEKKKINSNSTIDTDNVGNSILQKKRGNFPTLIHLMRMAFVSALCLRGCLIPNFCCCPMEEGKSNFSGSKIEMTSFLKPHQRGSSSVTWICHGGRSRDRTRMGT